jgi:hypothetical protein
LAVDAGEKLRAALARHHPVDDGNPQRIGDDDADVAVSLATTLSMMGTLSESATTTLTLQCGSFLDSAAFAQSGTSLEAIPVTTIG